MCITSLENLTAESLLTPPGVDLRDCIDDFRAGLTTWIGVFRGDTRLGLTNLISISSSSDVALCMNMHKDFLICFCELSLHRDMHTIFVVCSLTKSRQLNTYKYDARSYIMYSAVFQNLHSSHKACQGESC